MLRELTDELKDYKKRHLALFFALLLSASAVFIYAAHTLSEITFKEHLDL